jgi:sugar lactone lactonase YvrE
MPGFRLANCLIWFFFAFPLLSQTSTNFQIVTANPPGQITWTNAFTAGVCTVESAQQLGGSNGSTVWTPQLNYFTTNSAGSGTFALPPGNGFLRLRNVNVSGAAPQGFTNLTLSYGLLHTIAGSGADAGNDNVNYWQPVFENGYATNAALSRPHFAMQDGAGNIFIVDKNSHSVLRLTPDGRIHTFAGTHNPGNGPDTPTVATGVALNQPNGLWVPADGTVYILDTGNGKVRRVGANGLITTLFTDTNGISTGRGLWVQDDESLIYYASGKNLKQWTPAGGAIFLNKKFNELGNLIVSSNRIVATDRGDNTVWSVNPAGGARTLLFGNGGTGQVVDGTLALTNSLYGVRGVWQPPIGGYLLATDEGAQLLYVDTAGIIHVLINGSANMHAGDGQWFYTPGIKFGQLRSVSMDNQNNILVVENDTGFVRRIDFRRLFP